MLTKGNKIKKARIVKGTVLTANYAKHRYYVKHSDGVGWYAVSRLAAETQKVDLQRRKFQMPRRIMLMCQCRLDECVKRAEWQCSNQLSKGCCLASKMQCKFLEHNHDQTVRFSMDDFLKPNNDLTNFIDFITQVTTNGDEGDEQSTHDTLVSNALV